jgi:hypothetical protein
MTSPTAAGTPPEVTAAEQEAAEAADLLAALEEKASNGQDVTPRQLAEQRELYRFARLRANATRRKADHRRTGPRPAGDQPTDPQAV